MFERFTERARRVIILAQEEAKRFNHSAVGTEHILLGIIREGEGVASKVLKSFNINPEHVRAEIESAIGRGKRTPYEEVAFSPQAKKVLELALNEARSLGHNYIGTEHLLLGLIREGEGVAAHVLEAIGADLERVRSQIRHLLGEEGPTPMGSEMYDVDVCPIYFHDPSGIFVDGAGRIYVADSALHRIVRMDDMTGEGWTTLGTLGVGVNQFSTPSGVSVDTAGRIYVVDTGNHRVVRVGDMGGTEWTILGSPGTGVNQFGAPSGIFVDAAGRIYVVDAGSHRVVRVDDMTGAGWTALGTLGAGVNQFSAPFGVCVDKASRIYVTDSGNRRVIRMDDMTGAGWMPLGSYSPYGQFQSPGGVFVDEAGRIYVMDRGNYGIVRVDDMTGTGWTTLGLKSRLPGLYGHLIGNRAGIFVDRAGLIYVAGVTSGRSNGLVVQVTVKG